METRTDARVQQAREIFLDALEIASTRDRLAYLESRCGADARLRAEVETLLRHHERLGNYLECPVLDPEGTRDTACHALAEIPGTAIGPYKLLQQIGEGGMGVVYMAEQEHPVRRKVALKIIKPGMDAGQVVDRFEAERPALALMDHQNIARVLDAGTTDSGLPYFVMELVKGIPITEYCDANRLSPRERLELFVPVCRAIQHAHQKGIIHRDIKPSNVLVSLYDGVPVPKVIDFGVAKATDQRLTERTMFTQHGTVLGTLEYMSPEQAENSALDVDTRSDVYALGVLLYELLTGSTPLERATLREAGYAEILKRIKEEDPPRPSTRLSASRGALASLSAQRKTEPSKLAGLVRGELDWIVMKALEKDRTRRYETAVGFARDVERYLKDEAVEACPPSTMYRFRKFARKHKAALATAVVIAASLILGTTVSARQAVRATQAEAQANANGAQAQEKAQEAKEQAQEAGAQRDEAQRQRDEVRNLNDTLQRTLYAAHMNLAQHAWEAGGPERTRDLLEQHRSKPGEMDLRGFEWHFLYRLSHAELLTLNGHTGKVHSVAYSPDGQRLASADHETVKVWDVHTGQQLLSLQGGSVSGDFDHCVAFSPDGKRLAGAAGPGTLQVKVWDAQTGQELLSLVGHTGNIGSVAFSPDGKCLASGGWASEQGKLAGGEAKIWDAQTGRELLSVKGARGRVVFSPDGRRLASGTKVWDAQSGKELISLKGGTGFTSLAFSPDGNRLASACFYDKSVRVWDAQAGQECLSLKSGGNSVVFSPDGKRLAGDSDDKAVKVWDAQTGQELLSLKGHNGNVGSVAFSPDGKHLASGGDRTVKVWDARTDQTPLTLKMGISHVVSSLAFSPDGQRLASASDDKVVKVWDAHTGQALLSLKGHNGDVGSVAFSPDGNRLASVSLGEMRATGATIVPVRPGEVKLWDAQTGQELLVLKGLVGGHATNSVAFSPDGGRIATSGGVSGNLRDAGEVKVWDIQTGQELLTLKAIHYVYTVAFSPDGNRLAGNTGNWLQGQGQVKVWDAQTGQELLSLKSRGRGVAFSPDAKRLASGSQVWDAQTGQELLSLNGHPGDVRGVAFSPDGKRLVTASDDKTMKVWNAQTGEELLTVEGHDGSANGVAFSPDGHRLAGGAADGTIKIWDATPLPEKP